MNSFTPEQEATLVSGLNDALAVTTEKETVRPFKSIEKPQRSLTEQLGQLEDITSTLRATIMRRNVEIRNDHERRVAEIRIAFERDVVAAARKRDTAIATVERESRDRLTEIENLVSRLP